MNRTATLVTALAAAVVTAGSLHAQATAPARPAAAPTAAAPATPPPPPQAVDAKIALINFEEVVISTNEGQTVAQATQSHFAPQQQKLQQEAADLETLKKGLQSAPATLSDDERNSRLRQIDSKQNTLNRDYEDARNQYNTELQEALGKVAQKVSVVTKKYVEDNGYTILLDVSGQNSNVMWVTPKVNFDISAAVVDAYNKQSGVSAPPPQAPAAPSAARPATTPARPAARPSGK